LSHEHAQVPSHFSNSDTDSPLQFPGQSRWDEKILILISNPDLFVKETLPIRCLSIDELDLAGHLFSQC
jgi:hypothetical protein